MLSVFLIEFNEVLDCQQNLQRTQCRFRSSGRISTCFFFWRVKGVGGVKRVRVRI